MGLPPATQADTLAQLQHVEEIWQPYQEAIQSLIETDGADADALAYVQANSLELLKQSNAAVQLMEAHANNGMRQLIGIQVLGTVASLGLLTAIWFFGFSRLLRQVQRVAATANAISAKVAATARDLGTSSEELTDSSAAQSAAVEQASASLEELSGQIKETSANTANVTTTMTDAQSRVQTGRRSVSEMIEAMEKIDTSSAAIVNIIRSIDEIAFQTNLLALNASVEAARAGEEGRGFAVVAEEVRQLARRSAEASQETSQLIESTLQHVQAGSTKTREFDGIFGDIETQVGSATALAEEISTASSEQALAVRQITDAVSQIDGEAQKNCHTIQLTADSSHVLVEQSESLQDSVSDLWKLLEGKRRQKTQNTAPAKKPQQKRTDYVPESSPQDFAFLQREDEGWTDMETPTRRGQSAAVTVGNGKL